MTAGTYNINIESGDDWVKEIVYELGDPAEPVDLVADPQWSAEASFWDANGLRARIAAGPNVIPGFGESVGDVTLAADGTITFHLTEIGTYILTSSGRWEVRVYDGEGKPSRVMRGSMVVHQGPLAGILRGGEGY